MTKFRCTMLTATAALTLAALLTGCSIAAGDVTALIPSAGTATATPTPTPAPDALVGDVVTADTPLADGQRTYAMADGSLVVISSTGPVPDAVLADAKVGAMVFATTDLDGAAQNKSMIQQQDSLAEKLGGTKSIMIQQTMGFTRDDPQGGEPSPVYVMLIAGKYVDSSISHDPAAVTQTANDYIASHGGVDAGWKILNLF
ncbi:hypothetical protein E3T40_15420 [Cryobacterium sp. TMT1-19]|uniref:hypothetical protein n=1 Tax=unclassified Cryobacterium TaxID=2649013 RepID=UPI000CE3599E|nr:MULTISPECIES: hypothetical protein [unclassified Cryobacterium]TFD30380.1 hypothetical protein E3T40_15420 [Cryobacterium sp. TMT1-19]